MKKTISILLSMALIFSAFAFTVLAKNVAPENIFAENVDVEKVFAEDVSYIGTPPDVEEEMRGTCGENLTWTLDASGTLTISGTGDMENYSFSYQSPWNENNSEILNVIIENGVTSIGNMAFYFCQNLASVTVANSVTTIGESAFKFCSSLKSVTLPKSVTTIERYAFSYCSNLEEIKMSNSVNSIGVRAFSECTSLKSVEIPQSVTSIDCYTFDGCDNLESITIPDSVTSVGDGAFKYCKSLNYISLPDSISSIGDDVFLGSGYYKNSENWEDGALYIDSYLVNATYSISPDFAVKSGTKLIADCAFYYINALESVTIPDSVEIIGIGAFQKCSNLTELIVSENNKNFLSENGVLFDKNKTSIICYPSGKSETSYIIPDSVTNIYHSAFYLCNKLENVTIPSSVTSIGDYAFTDCHSLVSVVIPDSVTYIGKWAFFWNSKISSLTIGNSVKSIGERAFYNCSNLTSVVLPDSVTSIGADAFAWNTNLSSVTIGGSVTSIGDRAFEGCDNLDAITGIKGSVAEQYAKDNGFEFIESGEIKLPEGDYYLDTQTNTMPNVVAETTAESIISALANSNISATITDRNGATLESSAFVGTGCKVVTDDGEFTVIVKGDVDGSGEVDAADYLKVKGSLLGQVTLTDEFATAADADGNEELTSTDYLKIKGFFLGTFDLYA